MTKANDDIRHLTRQQLDMDRWDACIDRSPLIYARHWYLDHMTGGQWDALVQGEYEAVMPLPYRKKWGISYLYQPAFTQQLGIFSSHPPTGAFLSVIQKHFRFAEIFLNHTNIGQPTAQPSLLTTPQPETRRFTNLVLDLSRPYDEIAANYKSDLVANLKKAARHLHAPTTSHTPAEPPRLYTPHLSLVEALSLFRQQYGDRMPHVTDTDYRNFGELCESLQNRGQLILRAIRTPDNELLATALLPLDSGRLYLLQSTNTAKGRDLGANHYLLDMLIREFASQPFLLDFEGSELPGIAHFYRNFGSQDQPYFFYRYNNLPWPIRLLK